MRRLLKGNCMSACAGRIYISEILLERRICLERTDIAPDQLKMINNPPICKIAIYSAQARQPNLRNTALKTVPGGAWRQRCASIGWAKRGRALGSSYGRARKRAVVAAARQRPRLLLLLDFAGDFDYPASVAIITEANASTAKSPNRPVEMTGPGPIFTRWSFCSRA
jgi:hypothetical protein